jgi:hypothetical protein
MSRYALLNVSRAASNDFDAKYCSRMNTLSGREYIQFPFAQLLSNWHEQRPSNQGDLDSNVTGDIGRVYYKGVGPASDLIFVP